MPLLQVRDFPGDLYERLTLEAKVQHRSISQQTVVCIAAALDARRGGREGRVTLFRRIRQRGAELGAAEIDIAAMIREDRSR